MSNPLEPSQPDAEDKGTCLWKWSDELERPIWMQMEDNCKGKCKCINPNDMKITGSFLGEERRFGCQPTATGGQIDD